MKLLFIIPSKNSQKYIKKTLNSILKQDFKKTSFDIIVVDNGSIDNTKKIAKQYPLTFIEKPKEKLGALRNVALFTKQKYDYFIFIDSDCILQKNYIKDFKKIIKRVDFDILGGAILAPKSANIWQKAWSETQKKYLSQNKSNIGAANLIVKSSSFLKLGGFNKNLTSCEDAELIARARKNIYKIYTTNKMIVFHMGFADTLLKFHKREAWHAKEQLKGAKKITNKFLIAIHIYAFLLLFLPVFITLNYINFALFDWIFLCMLNLIFSLKKSLTTSSSINPIKRFLALNVLYFIYLPTRAFGLFFNWFLALKKRFLP